MNRSFMTILVLLATACPGSGAGETDGFGSETTDGVTGGAANTGPSTEGMSSTMTAGMTDAMSSTMTAGMTEGMTEGMTATEGDDMMNTTSGPADSTGSTPSACIESGQYVASLVGLDDPFGHLPFLQLFYSADAPAEPVDEIFVIDAPGDGTITVSILPRDSDGSSHEGASGLEGTIDEACEIEIVSQSGWDSAEGSFGTIDIELTGTYTQYQPTQVASDGEVTLSGGSIPSGGATYSVELVPQ